MPLWIAAMLQGAIDFDLARMRRSSELEATFVASACPTDPTDPTNEQIVICARRSDEYRLPLPDERGRLGDRVPGEIPNGTAALTSDGPCGIFSGERRCGKREAAGYGYGEGRDPITVLTKLAKQVIGGEDR